MPRQQRKKSISGIYHCILRGINKQDIFFENQDYIKFFDILGKSKKLFHFELYSYILMPNHIHLEIKEKNDSLSKIMQNIGVAYATYFNKKYNRVGHLFQNRFKSKAVETQIYMLNLLRYIHQNPEQAGIEKMEKYKWSSYNEYINKKILTDTEIVLKFFSKDNKKAIEEFVTFNNMKIGHFESDEILEFEIKEYLTDSELIEIIKDKLQIKNLQDIQKYSKKSRDELLKKLSQISGWTYKQMSRVLGINIRIIQRAIKEIER